ncbi:hypothetical protein [Halorubrum distributum]|uniref:hypothetical protein n=1 Tax=Halorubrum distributum TaxID=29283 RepID=UPI001268C569|nr:hypothetical protein [Halorubrum arcis]
MAKGDEIHPSLSPVDEVEAIGPAAVLVGVAALYTYERWGDQVIEGVVGDTNEQSHWSAVSTLLTTRSTSLIQGREVRSRLNQIEAGLFADVKNAIIESLNDGQDLSVATKNARDIVDKHINRIEKSLLENHRVLGRQLQTVWQDMKSEDLLGTQRSVSYDEDSNSYPDHIVNTPSKMEGYQTEVLQDRNTGDFATGFYWLSQHKFTTVNGEEYEILDISSSETDDYSHPYEGGLITSGNNDVELVKPDGSTTRWDTNVDWSDNYAAPDLGGWMQLISDRRDEILTQVDTIAEEIYANLSQGEVESPGGAYQAIDNRISEESDDGVASYGIAAELGYQTNVDADYTISYRERDSSGNLKEARELSGVLVADNDTFSDPIQTGNTYDTSNLSGKVYFLFNSGSTNETQEILLEGQFTVTEIVGDNGENLSEVEQQNNTFATRDTSDVDQQVEQINQRREQMNQRDSLPSNVEDALGGGGGLGLGGGFPTWILGVPVIGAIVAAWLAVQE